MPIINATLLATNSTCPQPQCPAPHGLSHGDIAAIVLGVYIGLHWTVQFFCGCLSVSALLVGVLKQIKKQGWFIPSPSNEELFLMAARP